MGDHFEIYDARARAQNGAGTARRSASTGELELLREQVRAQDETLEKLRSEAAPVGVVVEIRGERMGVSFGPGNSLDVFAIKGARVGDRVMCHRNSMQPFEVIRDAVPTGTVVVAQRQVGDLVEAEIMTTLRAFRVPAGMTIQKGERLIVDASQAFVLGSLGMPPQAYAHTPKVSVGWADVGGHELAKAALREAIELPFSHRELFASYGKRNVRGVLLSGPSGTGKTLLAKAAATAIARAHGARHAEGFVYVKGPELISKFIGATEEAIRRLFTAAREHFKQHGYPCVIFLDECDALLGARDLNSHISINATTVPQFLAEMDGLDDQATMIILATNRADMLDPAVTREGRIDRRVQVGRPSQTDAAQIFDIHLAPRPVGGDLDIAAIAADLFADTRVIRELGGEFGALRLRDFASGAMIAGIVEQASTAAMLRDVASGATAAVGITRADVTWAIDQAQLALAAVNHTEAIKERVAAQGA